MRSGVLQLLRMVQFKRNAVRKARRPAVTSYRPGLVVGDSPPGAPTVPGRYQVCNGFIVAPGSLPCQPDFQLDLAPGLCLCAISGRQLSDSANRTFHLTAGAGNTLPLNELVEIYLRACRLRGASTGPDRFAFASNGNSIPANHEVPAIWKRFAHYIPYFTCPKHSTPARASALQIYRLRVAASTCRRRPLRLQSGFRVPPAYYSDRLRNSE